MITRKDIDEELYRRYIIPTKKERREHIGVEFELPIVNLNKEPVDFEVVHRMVEAFVTEFKFTDLKYDDEGEICSALEPVTGDDLSFDCSYNTLEFSFGRAENLLVIRDRFRTYFTFISDYLREQDHGITGMGLNPYFRYNDITPVPNGRYRMLLHHLKSYEKYADQMLFHKLPYYGLIACSAQTHLDASESDLPDMINSFNRLEPLKALLLSNSPFEEPEGDYLCVRDHLWRESMHGLNPHNVDGWNIEAGSTEEIVAYIRSMSLYCTERDGKYINFPPMPLEEYFARDRVSGEYYDGGRYRTISWQPRLTDLEYLRSFKFVDLTFRGTIELRSSCMQPVREAMTVPAFHLGLQERRTELKRLLGDADIYKQGFHPVELRKLLVRRRWPAFADRDELRELLENLVALSADGLAARGLGEETLLDPLMDRAARLESPALEMLRGIEAGKTVEDYIREYGTL
ncbi:MAG: glutamylcysteine synthetase [Firmicutes bacterium]|nr:glutamylcysteine synthetase [Bacillota bacterium]